MRCCEREVVLAVARVLATSGRVAPRTRFHLLIFVGVPVAWIVVSFAAALVHPAFELLFVAWVIVVIVLAGRIRCPECAKPVSRAAGDDPRRRVVIPRACDGCGARLDR